MDILTIELVPLPHVGGNPFLFLPPYGLGDVKYSDVSPAIAQPYLLLMEIADM